MTRGRIAIACGVLAAVIGAAGVVAAVRHEPETVVSADDRGLPELPETPVVPVPDEKEKPDGEEPKPDPGGKPEPDTEPAPDVESPTPAPSPEPAPSPAPDDPYANVEPRGTLRPTATTPQPATKPTFDPAAYDIVAEVLPAPNSEATGHAGAKRLDENVWQVTIVVERLVPNTLHSIIVTRPEPSWGTPGPTPCEFTSTAAGWGTCTGEIYVVDGGQPEHVSLFPRSMGGGYGASGRFGPKPQ